MSWAKHDIEGWQAVEVAGVKMRMMKLPTQHKPTIETQDILEQLQDGDGPVWAALTEWAVKEIGLAEQNYLSSGSDPYYDEPPSAGHPDYNAPCAAEQSEILYRKSRHD